MRKQGELSNGYFNVTKKHLSGTTLPHWHDYFEIEYIVSGGGTYTIDGKEYPIEEGMIFFTGTSSFHRVSLENTLSGKLPQRKLAVNKALQCTAPCFKSFG